MKRLNSKIANALVALGLAMMVTTPATAFESVSSTRTIVQIKSFVSYAIIEYDPPQENGIGCTHPKSNSRAVIDYGADPDARTLLAMVTVAQTTNGKVGFGLHGCHASKFPLVYRIDSKNF